MRNMRFKVGDRVRIKSLDWYNENKDEYSRIICGYVPFIHNMSMYCGDILTICGIKEEFSCYYMKECKYVFTNEMIEGLVEEEALKQYEVPTGSIKIWDLPNGCIFKDENGNVINATKIVLEKKKKEYPKTYDQCCEVLGIGSYFEPEIRNATTEECHKFTKLIRLKRCRDAYWKLYGEEMGLGKPWEPDWDNLSTNHEFIKINKGCFTYSSRVLVFPTEEMRDAFKENFGPDIKICKEFL